MPDAVITPDNPAVEPAPAVPAAPAETKPSSTEAISEELGDAGTSAIKKEREARKDLERKLAESEQLQTALTAKVREFEDRDKSESEKLNDQLAALQKQIADKDSEIAAAKTASLRAEVAAAKGVPTSSLVGTTKEELESSADDLIAWRDTNTKRPPKPPVPSGGLKSGASGNGDSPSDPKERAAAALRAHRTGT